jgi:hypothetical protein
VVKRSFGIRVELSRSCPPVLRIRRGTGSVVAEPTQELLMKHRAGSVNSDLPFSGNSGRSELTPSAHTLAVSSSGGRDDRHAHAARDSGSATGGTRATGRGDARDSATRSLNGGGFDLQHNVRMKKATNLEQRGRGFATRSLKARPEHRSRSQKLIYVSYVIVEARYLR